MTDVDTLATFDFAAFLGAVDNARRDRDMGWYDLAGELWDQSAQLNAERDDHPLCGGAVSRLGARGETSCQYALYLLRWLGQAPEEFLTGPALDVGDVRLPDPGPDSRLRWDLAQLHAALNEERQRQGLTWARLAEQLPLHPESADQSAHRAHGRHGPHDARDPVAAQTGSRVHPSRGQPAPCRTALGDRPPGSLTRHGHPRLEGAGGKVTGHVPPGGVRVVWRLGQMGEAEASGQRPLICSVSEWLNSAGPSA